jgi:hypothetical protein
VLLRVTQLPPIPQIFASSYAAQAHSLISSGYSGLGLQSTHVSARNPAFQVLSTAPPAPAPINNAILPLRYISIAPPYDSSAPTSNNGPRFSLPAFLFLPEDTMKLSDHQILLRQQIEAFEASEHDVTTYQRGRNTPIVKGQGKLRILGNFLWDHRDDAFLQA